MLHLRGQQRHVTAEGQVAQAGGQVVALAATDGIALAVAADRALAVKAKQECKGGVVDRQGDLSVHVVLDRFEITAVCQRGIALGSTRLVADGIDLCVGEGNGYVQSLFYVQLKL